MADNIPITPGSGATVATDERTIALTTVHVQRVTEQGSTQIAAGSDTTVTTTAESIAARETRKRIVLRCPSSNSADVLVGASGAESFPIEAGGALTLYTTAAVSYKAASGTQAIYWIEEYDA
jgi:hypothetical protein